ncbi:MAG: hypothetical protein QOJ16_1659 [Acidobacteriota bacterium]|nr:hypothetical protein [Acidobacteriota bacterium]
MGHGRALKPPPALAAWVLALGWLAALFAPLAVPGRALANRDIALFHLPLRVSFARLAALTHSLPPWNPYLNGGQPILSNPSYAAFYPPSWLVLALPPARALSLLVVLHAGIAFAGAFHLARRLGCSRGAAALAALGYTGSGASLSLISAFTLFCSMAWFPWLLAWGDAALGATSWRERWKAALWAGGALALQLLNGEPATVLVSGFGLLCLAVPRMGSALRSRQGPERAALPRLLAAAALPVAVAIALALVQLLPTLGRLADSPRSGGLPPAQATTWSAPPERLIELVFPRFYGDPARDQENLYFGWHLHDRDYPYVLSIYPGLLLAVLGLSALLQWPIPRRAGLALAALLGAGLAIGRHNPLYEALRRAVPALGLLRFPEKFVILAVAALVFAGALGWQRLLDEREAGRRESADFPLALALVFLALATALTALLYARPALAPWIVRAHGSPHPTAASVARGVAFLRAEGFWEIGTAAAVALLLGLCRAAWPPRRVLAAAAVALLAADLWHYGQGLIRTLPVAAYERPPAAAAPLLPPRNRIYVPPMPPGQPELVLRGGDPGLALVRTQLERLDPYSGALWGLSYAGNEDYDLMLTGWARLALVVLRSEEEKQPDLARRFLGAWNVGTILLRRPPAEWLAEAQGGAPPRPARAVPDPYVLPRYRFVARVNFHPSYASALAVSRQQAYAVDRNEHCVGPERAPAIVDYPARPEILALADSGERLTLRYRSASTAFFTFATTFDPGWHAAVDAAPVPAWATAACQIGVELPAGEHRLVLAYSDPWVGVGAALSLAAILGWIAALVYLRRTAGGGDRREPSHWEGNGS